MSRLVCSFIMVITVFVSLVPGLTYYDLDSKIIVTSNYADGSSTCLAN